MTTFRAGPDRASPTRAVGVLDRSGGESPRDRAAGRLVR